MSTARQLSPTETVKVQAYADVYRVQTTARAWAGRIGFGRRGQWEIAIAASEAATNMIKHASGGVIEFKGLEGDRPGLRFEARDHGPGIRNLDESLEDGYSEGAWIRDLTNFRDRRGLGSGLPAIKRMMHEVSLLLPPEGGTILIAQKFLTF